MHPQNNQTIDIDIFTKLVISILTKLLRSFVIIYHMIKIYNINALIKRAQTERKKQWIFRVVVRKRDQRLVIITSEFW